MKRVALAAVLITLLCAGSVWAHTLFLSVMDNEDGTVTISGIYSTGAAAANTPMRLEDESGTVLYESRTDEFGELTFDKPQVPYTIILDGGPEHVATEEGPL
jgi:hypothetical protein